MHVHVHDVSRAKRGVGEGQVSHLPIHKNDPFPFFWLSADAVAELASVTLSVYVALMYIPVGGLC